MTDKAYHNVELPWTGERVVPDIPELEALFQFHWIRYSFAVANMGGKYVLDLGCGAGYGAHLLAMSDPGSCVVGMDIGADAIAYAKSHYRLPNLRYVVGDVLSPPFPRASFDLIVTFEVLEHLEDAQRSLELSRWMLKPDGVLIVSTPNREVYSKGHEKPWNPYHVREFSLPEFQALLHAQFSHVQIYGQQHTVGSLIWKNGSLANTAVHLDLVGNHPVSQATYLIAVCSSDELPSQSTGLWLMEVQDLQDVLGRHQHHVEELNVRVARLTEWAQELQAYQEHVEGRRIVRAWRRLQRVYAWLIKHTRRRR